MPDRLTTPLPQAFLRQALSGPQQEMEAQAALEECVLELLANARVEVANVLRHCEPDDMMAGCDPQGDRGRDAFAQSSLYRIKTTVREILRGIMQLALNNADIRHIEPDLTDAALYLGVDQTLQDIGFTNTLCATLPPAWQTRAYDFKTSLTCAATTKATTLLRNKGRLP